MTALAPDVGPLNADHVAASHADPHLHPRWDAEARQVIAQCTQGAWNNMDEAVHAARYLPEPVRVALAAALTAIEAAQAVTR